MLHSLRRTVFQLKRRYHQTMYSYNMTLYRDCFDSRLKRTFLHKGQYHLERCGR